MHMFLVLQIKMVPTQYKPLFYSINFTKRSIDCVFKLIQMNIKFCRQCIFKFVATKPVPDPKHITFWVQAPSLLCTQISKAIYMQMDQMNRAVAKMMLLGKRSVTWAVHLRTGCGFCTLLVRIIVK